MMYLGTIIYTPAMDQETSVTRDIIETRKVIQEKSNLLKRRREEVDEYYSVKYKPIVTPLKEFLEKIPPKRPSYLPIPNIPVRAEPSSTQHLVKLPTTQLLKPMTEEIIETPTTPLQKISEEATTPKGKVTVDKYLEKLGNISSNYITKFIENNTKELDDVYGIRYEGKGFVIGDTIVSIKSDVLEVDDDSYLGTLGLFELLFMKDPNMTIVKENDMKTYKKILDQTNAHKRRYSSSDHVNEMKHNPKYRKVISKLYPPPALPKFLKKKTGSGEVNPNKIVDRLRLLLESKKKTFEINQLESQLRQGGIIE